MKKVILSLLALGFVYSSSAWENFGKLERKENSRILQCNPGSGTCSKSVDPNAPEPAVGDKVLLYIDGEEIKATITNIYSDSFEVELNEDDPLFDVYGGVLIVYYGVN